jgi:AcrR family transcriptional regulator
LPAHYLNNVKIMKGARGRTAGRPSYHHGALRRALIDAASELAEDRRLSTVSLRAVARRAGVSPAAPYHYFADQAALWAAVAEAGFDLLDAALSAALASGPGDDVERLAALMSSYVRFALDRPQQFRLMFGLSQGQETSASLRGAATRVFERVTEAVRSARFARGYDDLEPGAITLMIFAVSHGLATLSTRPGLFSFAPPRVVEELARAATMTLVTASFEKGPDEEWGI